MQTSPDSVYNCQNPKGIKLLIKPNFGFIHLRYHQLKYKIRDVMHPPRNCWKR